MAKYSSQFRGLFLKNFALLKQQKGTIAVQLLVPFVLILLVGLMQMLIDNLAAKNSDPSVSYYGKVDLTTTIPRSEDGSVDYLNLFGSTPFFFITYPENQTDIIGEATYLGEKNGLLGNVEQIFQPEMLGLPETYWPFFEFKGSSEEVYDILIELYRKWKVLLNDSGLGPAPDREDFPKLINYTYEWLKSRDYEELLPYGAITFDEVSPEKIKYTALAASRYGGWSAKSDDANRSMSDIQLIFLDIDRRGNIINTIHNAYFNSLQPTEPVKITTYYQGFPQTNIFTFDVSSIAGLFLYGFVGSLLLPVFVSNIAIDKQEKILLMMQMSGLRMSIYWLVTYIFDMFLYIVAFLVIYLTSLAFQMRMFTQTSPLLLFIFFILWGNVLISLCFFLSTFFSKSRTASVVGYLIVIISVVISNLLNSSVFLSSKPPFWYMIYPPFAFYRGVFIMEEACIDLLCFQMSDIGNREELLAVLLYLLVQSLILFPATYYLQSVLPNEFGVRKHPLFFLTPCLNWCKGSKSGYQPIPTDSQNVQDQEVRLSLTDPNARNSSFSKRIPLDDQEDEDVIEERRRVLSGDLPSTAQVIVKNIEKEYDGRLGQPKKKALKGVSFFIDQNECFGLLGGNGAGKTTLISILTGVFSATNGTAIVANYDIQTDIDDVQKQIGVCPQFDIFYPDLSTKDHLLFYARVKGIDSKEEKKLVEKTLSEMGLTEVGDRLAKNLSGGMKRRLSMGIAIIGDPKIVILDEPTTGLDPLTRRQIWEILAALKKGRSMILTTHSMEEADVLCSRIGIMSRGVMKCIGTQERLKTKFGSGYLLTIFSEPGMIQECTKFVETNLPFVELEENFANVLSFRIQKDKLVVSDLFQLMQTQKPDYIEDWGLSMTTLEDVFVNIAKMDELEENFYRT